MNTVPWEHTQPRFGQECGYLSPLPKRGRQEEEFPLSAIQGTTKGKGGIFIDVRMMRTNGSFRSQDLRSLAKVCKKQLGQQAVRALEGAWVPERTKKPV